MWKQCNLWSKYAVTAKTIEAGRDVASEQLRAFLVGLRYAMHDAQVLAHECVGAVK
jgi:hypothetical protein